MSAAETMPRVELDERIRQCRIAVVHWVRFANDRRAPDRKLVMAPEVVFDLRGRTAGQWVRKSGNRWLRLNVDLIATEFESMIQQVIPHEVAHAVNDTWHGTGVRPHGPEWKSIMRLFGKPPDVRLRLQRNVQPTRTLRRYAYRCQCPGRVTHLTSIRHRRHQAGTRLYYCLHCHGTLVR